MRERLFSTAELGRLLRVSEATVKRWTDTGRIRCFRTPGGHRKFRLCDIAGFVETTGYELTGALNALLHDGKTDRVVETALRQDDFEALAREFETRATSGDVEGLHGMISCLRTRGICFATSIDEVVAPAFVSIGERWAAGELTTIEEHVATNATAEALHRLGEAQEGKSRSAARAAVCTCLEGERHDLATRAIALVLAGCGYRTVNVGGNTPVADLESHLRRHRPDLLAVSSKLPPDLDELERQVRQLEKAARRAGTSLVLGGSGFSLLPAGTRRMLTIVDSCRELASVATNGGLPA